MESAEVIDLFSRFEAAAVEYEGVECWSAREWIHYKQEPQKK